MGQFSDHSININREPVRGAILRLNDALGSLAVQVPPTSSDSMASAIYGPEVFGLRVHDGTSEMAQLIDGIAEAMWPEDQAAVAAEVLPSKAHLVVATKFPDDSVKGLQFFTTFKPGTAPWIQDEPEDSELRRIAKRAVTIDSSAVLQDRKSNPPGYSGSPSAYAMNFYWLVAQMGYEMAVLEINPAMKRSLDRGNVHLDVIPGAEPRRIGEILYSRYAIDPVNNVANRGNVDALRQFPPVTFSLDAKGVAVRDLNTPVELVPEHRASA